MDGNAIFHADPAFQSFIIRIVLPSGEAADWRIEDEISFHDVLVCNVCVGVLVVCWCVDLNNPFAEISQQDPMNQMYMPCTPPPCKREISSSSAVLCRLGATT